MTWGWSRIGGTGRTYHVADTGGGKTIQTALDLGDGDDVKVLGTSVVCAVHYGCDWETEGDAELAAAGATSTALRHGDVVCGGRMRETTGVKGDGTELSSDGRRQGRRSEMEQSSLRDWICCGSTAAQLGSDFYFRVTECGEVTRCFSNI